MSERLDVIPAQFRVLVIRRPRYACRACGDAIVQAPAPARLIEDGLPTDALVAQVLVLKYATTCRSIDRRRSSPARALASTARRWPTGSGAPPSSSGPCTRGCWRRSSARASCLRGDHGTVLDPGRGRPRPASLGRMRATTGPGAGRIRPASLDNVYGPTARLDDRSRISPGLQACCRSTAKRPTRRWPRAARCGWLYC